MTNIYPTIFFISHRHIAKERRIRPVLITKSLSQKQSCKLTRRIKLTHVQKRFYPRDTGHVSYTGKLVRFKHSPVIATLLLYSLLLFHGCCPSQQLPVQLELRSTGCNTSRVVACRYAPNGNALTFPLIYAHRYTLVANRKWRATDILYCYRSLNCVVYRKRVVVKSGAIEFRVFWMQAVKVQEAATRISSLTVP